MNARRSRPLAPSVLESWEAERLGGSSALGCHSAFRISHSALGSPLPAVWGGLDRCQLSPRGGNHAPNQRRFSDEARRLRLLYNRAILRIRWAGGFLDPRQDWSRLRELFRNQLPQLQERA